jgi:uncharacterized protein YegP (UPF0339 family)
LHARIDSGQTGKARLSLAQNAIERVRKNTKQQQDLFFLTKN